MRKVIGCPDNQDTVQAVGRVDHGKSLRAPGVAAKHRTRLLTDVCAPGSEISGLVEG